MDIWWSHLTHFEQVYWLIAIPSSVILVCQLLLTFVAGIEASHAVDVGHHQGDTQHGIDAPHFQLFTVRSVIAFFAIFGWSGLALFHLGLSKAIVLSVSIGCGFACMVVVAILFYLMMKLTSDGTANLNEIVGLQGTVYFKIPASKSGFGSVNVVLQGKTQELKAQTSGEQIETGATIKVVSISNNLLIVERA